MPERKQPVRTLGISLAIFLSLVLFTLIPLVQVFFTLYIRSQISESGVLVGGTADAIGGSLGIAAVSNAQLLLRGVPALLYVGVAAMAWRGTPPTARYALSGSVVLLWLYYRTLNFWSSREFSAEGGVSSDVLLQWLRSVDFVISLLVVVYVVWYMNRAPARAFYQERGGR